MNICFSSAGPFTGIRKEQYRSLKRLGSNVSGFFTGGKSTENGVCILPFLRIFNRIIRNHFLQGIIYDAVVSSKMKSDCDIFIGWNGACIRSLRKAKKNNAITIVCNGTGHILDQYKWLKEEEIRFKFKEKNPTPGNIAMQSIEIEEANYVIVPSEFTRDSFIRRGSSDIKIFVAQGGIKNDRFLGLNKTSKRNDIFQICAPIGMLDYTRGGYYILEAWRRLRLKNAKLYINGMVDTPFAKYLYNSYKKIPSVQFSKGHLPDIRTMYENSKICVFCGIMDGFPSTILEAMCSGLPVVVSEQMGAKMIIKEGENGFVVKAKSIGSIMEKILYFYNNRSEIKRMGENARKDAIKYNEKFYMLEFTKVIETIKETLG